MTPEQEASMRLQITRYVAGLTRPIAELATEDTTHDCWDCSMYVPPNNVPMGDYYHSYEHLILHMQEWVYPGTMLVNAWEESRGKGAAHPNTVAEVKTALQAYLEKRLLSSESRLLA